MLFRITFLLVGFLILFSCKDNKTSPYVNNEPEVQATSAAEVLSHVPPKLTVSEYLDFLKKMRGVTFDEVETPLVYINLLYKPQAVEAALSLAPEEWQSAYKETLEQKKGYHYLLISFLDKNPSVTGNRTSKKEMLSSLVESIEVIKNESDTSQAITEVVASSVSSQPDQVIVLVPEASTDRRLRVLINGKHFDIRDVAVDLPVSMLHKFPELEL